MLYIELATNKESLHKKEVRLYELESRTLFPRKIGIEGRNRLSGGSKNSSRNVHAV